LFFRPGDFAAGRIRLQMLTSDSRATIPDRPLRRAFHAWLGGKIVGFWPD